MSHIELTVPFAGSDITFSIQYEYTPGASVIVGGPADNWDPGYPAEIQFLSIEATIKTPDHILKADPASQDRLYAPVPGWLFDIISNDDEIFDMICAKHEDGPDPDYALEAKRDDESLYKDWPAA